MVVKNLRKSREEMEIKQKDVSEFFKLSFTTISGWETGAVVPSIENLKSLSVLYGVPVDHLLSREGERLPTETAEEKESKERRHKLKKRAIIILVLIGIVLVCVGSFLFANGSLFQGENKQMDSANVDEPTWEEQDLSKKGALK